MSNARPELSHPAVNLRGQLQHNEPWPATPVVMLGVALARARMLPASARKRGVSIKKAGG